MALEARGAPIGLDNLERHPGYGFRLAITSSARDDPPVARWTPSLTPAETATETATPRSRLNSAQATLQRVVQTTSGAASLTLLKRFWPAAAVLGGGVVLLDSLHGALSSLLSLAMASAGLWLLADKLRPGRSQLPSSSAGWLERLETLLDRFARLDPQGQGAAEHPDQQRRQRQLAELRQRQGRTHLELALVGCRHWDEQQQNALLAACPSPLPLRVHRSHALPPAADHWQWPEAFRRCDLLIYRLDLPLKAADLRWLEAVPQGQSVWVLVDGADPDLWPSQHRVLQLQLPEPLRERCWSWSAEQPERLRTTLAPLAQQLADEAARLPERTERRNLEDLHGHWQLELEGLRRRHWQQLLQSTQWTVAAGVLVAPVPSLDLLVLTAANGLMLREMARLWDCPWSLDQLQAAAVQLARAALSLGVVEWSSQALGTLVRLHAATWLVGGALQALSAAYLTRVVGRAMADYLALAAGVPEAELEGLLQRQAPLLVARAAEEERIDWTVFLHQAGQWLQERQRLTPSDPRPAPAA